MESDLEGLLRHSKGWVLNRSSLDRILEPILGLSVIAWLVWNSLCEVHNGVWLAVILQSQLLVCWNCRCASPSAPLPPYWMCRYFGIDVYPSFHYE